MHEFLEGQTFTIRIAVDPVLAGTDHIIIDIENVLCQSSKSSGFLSFGFQYRAYIEFGQRWFQEPSPVFQLSGAGEIMITVRNQVAVEYRAIMVALIATSVSWCTGCASLRVARQEPEVLKPFATDGCSLFPDGTFKDKTMWQECCIQHDIAYWKGGTEEDRRNADRELRACILEKTGDKVLSQTIYNAVRSWGSPMFPAWYRWGYGWTYGRGYSSLTEEDQLQVKKRLQQYYGNE